MSTKKLRQMLINLVPIRSLQKWLSYRYGWFPGNYVNPGIRITAIDNLKLGGNVFIGGGGAKLSCEGGLEIGKNTAVAEGCFFMTANHNYKSKTHVPFDRTGILQKIVVGENCWIGAKCTICPGVKIDDGAVVAMGSVVTKSVPKCAVVGGNPAKIIGWRNIEEYEENAKANRTWNTQTESKMVRIEEFKKYLE